MVRRWRGGRRAERSGAGPPDGLPAGAGPSATRKWWPLSPHTASCGPWVARPDPALQPGLGDRPPARRWPGRWSTWPGTEAISAR